MGAHLEVTSENLLPALDLFAEVLLEPGFDAEEIERERRETLAAIDRREDQLAQRAFALFQQTEFETHPYRQSIIGERETVERFDAATIQAHQDRLIQLPNLVLSVAGDVDPDEIAAAMSSRLSGLSPGPFALESPPPEPERSGVREARWSKDREQAHLVIGFRGLTVDDPDRHVLEVISQILAGQGGRLFLDLRDKRSLAYSVSAMNIEGVAPGFFAVYIATSPDKLDVAERGIHEHLDRLVSEAPGADELVHTKRHLTGNYAIDQQRNAARAAHIALDSLYGLGPREHLAYPEHIEAVTRDDVLRVAQRVLRLDAYTLALVAP
jgi:zinc protease